MWCKHIYNCSCNFPPPPPGINKLQFGIRIKNRLRICFECQQTKAVSHYLYNQFPAKKSMQECLLSQGRSNSEWFLIHVRACAAESSWRRQTRTAVAVRCLFFQPEIILHQPQTESTASYFFYFVQVNIHHVVLESMYYFLGMLD